jgi:NAD(P)-dependent dehydrogenase (short-subunit alcohol dehydrogenase family)
MAVQLLNKVSVITGAARGLGRACAEAFAEAGADLILVDIAQNLPGVPYPLGSRSQLEHTAKLCRELGSNVFTAAADIRDMDALVAVRESALDRFGAVDVVVNNAGIAAPSGKPVHEITEDEWQLMLDVDLTGAWRVMKVFAPAMLDNRAGSIINIASTAGLVGYRKFSGYVSAKHGLVGLTKAAALDYAPMKVRVNAICPGNIRDNPLVEGRMLSEIARSLDIPVDEHEATFVIHQPMNVLLEPADVAAAAVWLASDASRYVTGTTLTVDAGYTAV